MSAESAESLSHHWSVSMSSSDLTSDPDMAMLDVALAYAPSRIRRPERLRIHCTMLAMHAAGPHNARTSGPHDCPYTPRPGFARCAVRRGRGGQGACAKGLRFGGFGTRMIGVIDRPERETGWSLMKEPSSDGMRESGRESQPTLPMRDAVGANAGFEFHPLPSGSTAEVPKMVESERCDGLITLYCGHLVAGGQHARGDSVELDRSDFGGLEGRPESSAYTTEVCGRRRKVNWNSGFRTLDMGEGGMLSTHSEPLERMLICEAAASARLHRVGGKGP